MVSTESHLKLDHTFSMLQLEHTAT